MSQSATLALDKAPRDGIANQLDYANQYVSFFIDRQLLGIPVNAVQEVLNPQAISPVPLARAEISGLLNLRGQIVTAVNLRRRLALPDLDRDTEGMNVVVRHLGESFSLQVDDVGDVINVSGTALEAAPSTLDAHWKTVTTGVFRLDEQLFVILNVASLLNFR
jgi:purine-binding chemotaxis protein CheW